MDWYIGKEWHFKSKGISKKVLSIQFSKVEKPQLTSVVQIKVSKVEGLNERPSKYLQAKLVNKEQNIEMGTAETPVDFYMEMLVEQMIVGETCECRIETKSGVPVTCELTLLKILSGKEIHKLTVGEMYELALLYKENGVTMFKQYPKFAHDYFARAAKLLISYQPFDNLTTRVDGMGAKEMTALLVQLQTNLAACLLNEKRYEDVIYQTAFVETSTEPPSEKSVYRRALAFYHIKEYEKALKTIDLLPNHKDKSEFVKLRENITTCWKDSNSHYKELVHRMFSSSM